MKPLPLEQLEKQLGHRFQNKALIKDALTHSSTNEDTNYERLEFLGDRVLGLVIANALYEKFPDEAEGDLAKRLAALVQGELLAVIALEMKLGKFIILSDAEAQAGGAENENILSDVFEAIIGALYLDGGFEKCKVLIEKLWTDKFFEMKTPPQHPKTVVQEWAQGQGLPLPSYKILNQHGPDHAPLFDVQLTIKGYEPVTAQGSSRQEAEKQAAKMFFEKITGQK
jgi:ribonuclease III